MTVLTAASGLHQTRNKEAEGYSYEETYEKCEHGGTPLSLALGTARWQEGQRYVYSASPKRTVP
jgi:hypothetical protein